MRLAWLMIIAGGVMVVTPGMLDPLNAPINGLTLLGIILAVAGVIRAGFTA